MYGCVYVCLLKKDKYLRQIESVYTCDLKLNQ